MDLARDDDAMKQAQSFIEEGAAAGQLSPLIAGTFPLNEIVIAHRELENGSHVGKLVVVPE